MTELLKVKETMSSLQIAEITGKRHDAILRDIKSLLSQGVNAHNFVAVEYTDNGKYTVNENVITIYWQGDNEPVILHFSINGNTMRTYMEGETGYTDWTRQ